MMMQLTKYIHSCLFLDIDGKKILIDPGNYTYDAKVLDLNTIDQLDYLLITHEHPDHMYVPFIKEILTKFPNVSIITNPSAKNVLEKEGIESQTQGDDFIAKLEDTPQLAGSFIKIETVPHEKVFGVEPPQNVMFDIGGKLTHPGDSLHFNLKTPILALPVQAPWCSLTQAVEFAVAQKPQAVLPIHDWHWNDLAREAFYKRLEKYFGDQGIKFISLKTGEKVTIP